MDEAYLKKLIDWLAAAPISEIEIVEGDTRIHLVKGNAGCPVPGVPAAAAEATAATAAEQVVRAPLPGVFYLRASPEADPMVSVGQRVAIGDPIGLVEAMKMFNPVSSDADGVVEAILVESGEEVAAGQPLLRLRPAGEEP